MENIGDTTPGLFQNKSKLLLTDTRLLKKDILVTWRRTRLLCWLKKAWSKLWDYNEMGTTSGMTTFNCAKLNVIETNIVWTVPKMELLYIYYDSRYEIQTQIYEWAKSL